MLQRQQQMPQLFPLKPHLRKAVLNMIKWNGIFFLLLGSMLGISIQNDVQADDSKVVDLGEMSVHGEIRRPAITWIDSQKPVKDVLSDIVKKEFERFETELLRQASSSIATEINPIAESNPAAESQP